MVTFTLPGFNTLKRDGIELTGNFVASVNAELRVGAYEETVTVTGESPLVDIRSAGVQRTITKDVVDAIPTGRLGVSLAALVPGMYTGTGAASDLTVQDVGGVGGDRYTDLKIHGRKAGDQVRAGYLRRNGVPYSENAIVTEYLDWIPAPNGDQWLIVKTIVDDPTYLVMPFVTSAQFKREPDATKWNPTPCEVIPPPK